MQNVDQNSKWDERRCNSSMIVRIYCARSGTSIPIARSMHMHSA